MISKSNLLPRDSDFSRDFLADFSNAQLNVLNHDDDDLKPLLQSVSQCVVHDISSTATDMMM